MKSCMGLFMLKKVVQSADILKFSFWVRVSEIDKHSELPVIEKDTKRIVAVTDIVTKAELEEAIKNIHVEVQRMTTQKSYDVYEH